VTQEIRETGRRDTGNHRKAVTQAGRVTRSMLHWKQEEQEGGDTGSKRSRKEVMHGNLGSKRNKKEE